MSVQDVMPVVGPLAASAEGLAVLATSAGKPLDGLPAQVREVLVWFSDIGVGSVGRCGVRRVGVFRRLVAGSKRRDQAG